MHLFALFKNGFHKNAGLFTRNACLFTQNACLFEKCISSAFQVHKACIQNAFKMHMTCIWNAHGKQMGLQEKKEYFLRIVSWFQKMNFSRILSRIHEKQNHK